MTVKVVKEFVDKNTRELRTVGEIIEVEEARANEILAAGKYIEVEEEKAIPLDKMKVDDLKAFAAEKGIDISEAQNKTEILEILKNHQ